YHRRFIEVANKYYVSNLSDKERTAIFSNVIDFFNETWKNKPKPYKYNEYLAKKFGLKDRKSKETRETGIQATMFVDQNGTIRYNKRKINELPDFISKLTPNVSLPLICELVFFDLNFLSEIFDLIDPFSSISSYAMTRDTKNAINELSIFEFALLQ
ncbi:NACHT and WD repeat domain-containing 2-like, partial [Brachionus plicatilis]